MCWGERASRWSLKKQVLRGRGKGGGGVCLDFVGVMDCPWSGRIDLNYFVVGGRVGFRCSWLKEKGWCQRFLNFLVLRNEYWSGQSAGRAFHEF